MNKSIKQLNRWVHSHPYKAILFAIVFTFDAAVTGFIDDRLLCYGVLVFIIVLAGWVSVFWWDTRKLGALLIAAMLAASVKAEEPRQEPRQVSPVGIGVGVVVICVGGYCIYRISKFCQRKFPKETAPNTNASPSVVPGDGGEMAASWNYGSAGSCDPTLEPPGVVAVDIGAPTMFRVDVNIDADGNVQTHTSAVFGEAVTQGWTEFQAEVARHGIYVTGSADGSQFFSINRQPCAAGQIPISFDLTTHVVNIRDGTGPAKLIEVERSRDMVNWSPFLVTKLRAGGRGARIEDASTASSMFYRVKVSDSTFSD